MYFHINSKLKFNKNWKKVSRQLKLLLFIELLKSFGILQCIFFTLCIFCLFMCICIYIYTYFFFLWLCISVYFSLKFFYDMCIYLGIYVYINERKLCWTNSCIVLMSFHCQQTGWFFINLNNCILLLRCFIFW